MNINKLRAWTYQYMGADYKPHIGDLNKITAAQTSIYNTLVTSAALSESMFDRPVHIEFFHICEQSRASYNLLVEFALLEAARRAKLRAEIDEFNAKEWN